ncbi:succinyldiaminopimelate transaminase [Helcobacillus sp. ACRRO]|uniref:succinyldiaminopimelate transaminase n=1 Tax=Helcobacillus sp. ACRRO TaxID=2918202 RepID=UPI001EF6D81A|nr:succinyldiaminopimelate transaminase [Helcobacillus sp. ACRRO]MCG7427529.1 succinyldiaminopimelate transaminase [Helcobacillus sp. ACRRO]
MTVRRPLASRLPDFPWDSLEAAKARAAAHSDGIVNLSVGTPVDATPSGIQEALAAAADSHGYPQTIGTPALQDTLVAFAREHRGAPAGLGADGVLPTIGSKELVAHLPFQLGLGAEHAVAFPHIAYPTYDMGARFVGAQPLPVDIAHLAATGEARSGADGSAPLTEQQISSIALLWLNSPSNPTGEVLDVQQLRSLVEWARERGIIIASDECYALLPWTVDEVPSVLDPRVNGGDLTGVLCTYSLSKQSNLAGYRAAFIAGDPALIAEITAIRKQAGMMMPGPIQDAMVTALADLDSVGRQHAVYRARREVLKPAIEAAGGEVSGSQAGLYLWTSFGMSGDDAVERLADLGILCAPGRFYGEAGNSFVRIALTESDERIRAAADRLSTSQLRP